MSDVSRSSWRVLARSNDDPVKIVAVAVLVALVSALVVSTASVVLKPLQEAHLQAERDARMAAMLDTLPGMRALLEEAGAENLTTRLVDLDTGEYATGLDPAAYDARAAAADPATAVAIDPAEDVAGLKQRAPLAPVHLLEADGRLLLVVLPMHGTGYQSTLRALLTLEADLRTVAAMTITEQGETPGLGARIEEPAWQGLWPGKVITDDSGAVAITVVRGQATGPHEVDGVSGATRTGNGIGNMLKYWLGPDGYGPFLDRMRAEAG